MKQNQNTAKSNQKRESNQTIFEDRGEFAAWQKA